MFIGSTPGASEEAGSSPLQGDEGQLLDRMFSKMGIQRSDVYLCHALPCRPAQDRTPTWDELNACRPKLLQRVEQVQPKIIVTLGTVATQALLSRQVPITKVRGQWQDHVGTPVMPTYHPAYLLKKTSARKDVWSDMLAVLKALNPKG
jgi:DNA polymerase